MRELSLDELRYLAAKARLPEKLVLDAARQTVARFRDEWPEAKKALPVARPVAEAIDAHLQGPTLLSEV